MIQKFGLFAMVFGLLLSSSIVHAVIDVDCPAGYGPASYNLAVTPDDEEPGQILSIGFKVLDVYFKMEKAGCSSLTYSMDAQTLSCDGKVVGQVVSQADDVIGELGYRHWALGVNFVDGTYDITGSCNPDMSNPLTISFRK